MGASVCGWVVWWCGGVVWLCGVVVWCGVCGVCIDFELFPWMIDLCGKHMPNDLQVS